MKFDKFPISEEIKKNLLNMGFFRTTDIQYKAIPAILNGEDVLAIAQTGSGKTAAFAIPIINQIHEEKTSKRSRGIRCLIMVPTRELAKQIGTVIAELSYRTKANSYAIYGGIEEDQQLEQLEGGVDILIATPGRMFDFIRHQVIDISRVSTLVLDEADRMLDLGFIDDIKAIKRLLKHRHQTLFFSATINPKIKKLAYSQIKSDALRIQVSPEKQVSKNISHFMVSVEMDDKRTLLANFIRSNPDAKTIVFVRTQVRAERVLNQMLKVDIAPLSIHGGMDQQEREKNLDLFRRQKAGVLIATDVTARGIDLPGITHVINYDLPDNPENYVHRIGRTGRGFAKGEAISFCSSEEKDKLKAIEEFLQMKIPQMKLTEDALVVPPTFTEEMSTEDFIAEMVAAYGSPKERRSKKGKASLT